MGGLAAVWLASGCATGPDRDEGAPGRLVFASTAITNSLDPLVALSSVGSTFCTQVYDPLVALGEDGRIVPALATAWKQVDDLTVEFTLREGVKFHNGGAFDARAVVENAERLLTGKPEFATIRGEMGPLKGVEAVDDRTVRVRTETPDPILLNRLTRLYIVDPSVFGQNPATTASGTGPFKVVGYKAGESIDLEAFPDSWRKSSSLQRARILAIPDTGTLTTALRSGDVDAVFGLPPAVSAQLSSFTVQAPSAGSCAILSMIPDVEPKLRDKNIRLALNLAIDNEEFVKEGLSGFGEVPTGQLLQPGYTGYDPSLQGFAYDPDKARSLLAGTDLKLDIATTALFKQQAEITAGYLGEVGVKSEVVIQDLSTFVTSLLKSSKTPLLYWQTDYFDLRDIASVARFGPQPPGVQSHFEDDEYVELFTAAQKQMDPAEREETIRKMARRMNEEVGVVFLAWPKTVYVSSKKTELKLTPSGNVTMAESKKSA